MKKILIIGGGFAGIKCALELSKKNLEDIEITLVSDKPHFEYHAYLYLAVTGRSACEVCVPLYVIFNKTSVSLVKDFIVSVDLHNKLATGSSNSHYKYDFLVLAAGSVTEYSSIEGLAEYSHGFKTIKEATELKKYIKNKFIEAVHLKEKLKNNRHVLQIAVIGAGSSGVELAAELANYTNFLSNFYKVDLKFATVGLIEKGSRVLPSFPKEISEIVIKRLRQLGVYVTLNRTVIKKELHALHLNDTSIKAGTVIWTAGTHVNKIYSKIKGLKTSVQGKVSVNRHLALDNYANVFIAGDGAHTKHSGFAQTALRDGVFIANNISNILRGLKQENYIPIAPFYCLSVGTGWGIFSRKHTYAGKIGWILRRLVDLKFFLSILPVKVAIRAFRFDKIIDESCDICSG